MLATLEVVDKFRELLESPTGMGASLGALKAAYRDEEAGAEETEVAFLRVPAELHEKARPLRYPVIHVYCDRVESQRTEKFRRFSGTVRLVTEVRISQDRLDGISERLHMYADAVRDVIERNSGCLGKGLYLDGDYSAAIEPVRKGGLNYLQVARITCSLILNRS